MNNNTASLRFFVYTNLYYEFWWCYSSSSSNTITAAVAESTFNCSIFAMIISWVNMSIDFKQTQNLQFVGVRLDSWRTSA